MPHTLPALLGALTTEPGRPRLTWYGGDGERIELSGAVLVNWVSKTTNLLVEEFDAEPGTLVVTDLPPHWRTLVWALATWRAGAHLGLTSTSTEGTSAAAGPAETSRADVVVTAAPERWLTPDGERPARTELVAVTLPALARSFDGDLPSGAVDAASAVMTYGDQIGYVPATDGDETALSAPGVEVTHAELLGWARALVTPAAPGDRVLVSAQTGPDALPRLLASVLDVWAADGSVVLVAPEAAAALEADPERLERLLATERVTARR